MQPRDLVAPFLETRFGFPRVDWPRAALAMGSEGTLSPGTKDQLVVGWLEHVVLAKGEGARSLPGVNFHLVEVPADERAQHVLRWAEEARAFLTRNLDGIAAPHASPLPLLLFTRVEDFVDWVFDHETPDAEHELASAGGVFINGPCPHIAAPYGPQLESTLVHELAHALVHHLPLPAWLNEGIAVAMQWLWAPQSPAHVASPTPFTAEDIREQRQHWNEATIQRFWSGRAFRDPHLQRVAYPLALLLVTRLAGNYARLLRFANAAIFCDAGAAAFSTTYGEPLSQLLEPLLGRGAWQPNPASW